MTTMNRSARRGQSASPRPYGSSAAVMRDALETAVPARAAAGPAIPAGLEAGLGPAAPASQPEGMTPAPDPAQIPCHVAGRPADGHGGHPAGGTRYLGLTRTRYRPDTETDAPMPVRAGAAYPRPILHRPTSAAIAVRPGPGTNPAGSRLRCRPRQAVADSSRSPPPARHDRPRSLLSSLQQTRQSRRRCTVAANLTRPRDRCVSDAVPAARATPASTYTGPELAQGIPPA